MHNMHIRKLNSLGVTNVGHCDLIDLCDECFKVQAENLGLITKKMGNNFVTLMLFDLIF